jgi:hypothetical protein
MPIPALGSTGAVHELALATAGTLIRKTSLQDRTDDPLRSGKRADKTSRAAVTEQRAHEEQGAQWDNTEMWECVSAWPCRSVEPADLSRYSERSSLHDVRYHAFVACLAGKPTSPSCNQLRICFLTDESQIPTGGARRDRTDDLLLAKQALSQLSYGPRSRSLPAFNLRPAHDTKPWPRIHLAEQRRLVGLGRFELPTSRLSSARSNQLSYKP